MSTNSRIGLLQENGSVLSIYCHWDGYVEHNGEVLFTNYTEVNKIKELLNLGDLSSLGPDLGEKHDFEKKVEGWCTAYGRDREETDTEAHVFSSEEEYIKEGEEFTYLYKNNSWYVSENKSKFEVLADVLKRRK